MTLFQLESLLVLFVWSLQAFSNIQHLTTRGIFSIQEGLVNLKKLLFGHEAWLIEQGQKVFECQERNVRLLAMTLFDRRALKTLFISLLYTYLSWDAWEVTRRTPIKGILSLGINTCAQRPSVIFTQNLGATNTLVQLRFFGLQIFY